MNVRRTFRASTGISAASPDPAACFYEQRFNELTAEIASAHSRVLIAGAALAVSCTLFLVCGFAAIQHRSPVWLIAFPLLTAIICGRRYSAQRRARYKASRLSQHYRNGIDRLTGNWAGSGPSGEEFQDPEHTYTSDLNVFGEGSLFELICTARTGVGRRGLAEVLTSEASVADIRLRQQAVLELRERTDLREHVALLGEYHFRESNSRTFSDWLATPRLVFPSWLQKALWITSALIALLFLAGMSGAAQWKGVGLFALPLLIFQAVAGALLRHRVNEIIAGLHALTIEISVIREGFQLLEATPFESLLLLDLTSRTSGAAHALSLLERLLTILRERNKEWFYSPSVFLALGTQLCMAIENWRDLHGGDLPNWLSAWAQFEALNSLAGYAYENPENAVPEFVDIASVFEATSLGHPLISMGSCVTNNVAWNPACRLYVISGSNMAGKSTLLRAIGLNAVLARAGAPVRAASLRTSNLRICASVAVTDSLLTGKSRFLAEMDRLRQMLSAAESEPVLFLIDEIMSGTNSSDRLIASEAVLRTLIDRGAIGAISTHDLALTGIANIPEVFGRNMHMASRGHDDPLDFDYLLKSGVTPEANALAIAKLAGVPLP